MVELIIEVKNGKAYLAMWHEDWSGVRIERLITPNVSPEDIEEAIKQAGGSLQDEFVHFAEKLTLHAQTEEEVLYPASILVGDYLKLRMK